MRSDLPAWFYYVYTTLKEVALIKSAGSAEGSAPDVRPIGIGECLRRAIHTTLASDHKGDFAEHLFPQQVAVGMPGGISKLVIGVRLIMEVNPTWVIVKIDLKNAYNEIKRAKVIERMNADDRLRALVPLMWASYSAAPDVYLAGGKRSGFASEEGMHQGDPLASGGFCVGVHPEICELDAELQPSGGSAKFDMDDGYAMGPPEVVFPATLRFAANVQEIGLQLQLSKCTCYSAAGNMQTHPERPPEVKVGMLRGSSGEAGYGVEVAGVPVGDPIFVATYLDQKATDAMSKIRSVKDQLHDRNLPSPSQDTSGKP